jgi:folate-binding protein YgfZ
MPTEANPASAAALSVLSARGADVVSFLQGQLSNDITRLQPQLALLAGYHNPQGRVIALIWLAQLTSEEILLLVPRELLGPVAGRLTKYILRSRVRLSDADASWQVTPALRSAAAASAPPASAGAVTRVGESLVIGAGEQPPRYLVLAPRAPAAALPSGCVPADAQSWERLEIAAGVPQVRAATSEEFVAQMLNLDALGAIAFDKGCYTGQEVIARAHYRGRVKRRMQRFATRAARVPGAGEAGTLADGRAFRVVRAVATPDGGCEFLAVAPLPGAGGESAGREAAPRGTWLAADCLPLPYPLEAGP